MDLCIYRRCYNNCYYRCLYRLYARHFRHHLLNGGGLHCLLPDKCLPISSAHYWSGTCMSRCHYHTDRPDSWWRMVIYDYRRGHYWHRYRCTHRRNFGVSYNKLFFRFWGHLCSIKGCDCGYCTRVYRRHTPCLSGYYYFAHMHQQWWHMDKRYACSSHHRIIDRNGQRDSNRYYHNNLYTTHRLLYNSGGNN